MKSRIVMGLMLSVFFLGCSSSTSGPKPTAEKAVVKESSTPVASTQKPNAPKRKLTVGLSIYTGWMPHYLAAKLQTFQKWGEKEGVEIEIVFFPTYPKSIDAYNAKQIDAVVIANMDAMSGPCVNGIDSTVLIMGDYSNGNDKVLVRGGLTMKDLATEPTMLYEGSVSQYLLFRGLQIAGADTSKQRFINTPDDKHVVAFQSDESVRALATWNPWAMQIAQMKGVTSIFDSSMIKKEIQDLLIARTEVVRDYPGFARAVVGTWYETLDYIQDSSHKDQAVDFMAKESMCTPTEFLAQWKTTAMFLTPALAVEFTSSPDNVEANTKVLDFLYKSGIIAPTSSKFGISFPDGKIIGDKDHVMLRFDASYMEAAGSGKL